MARACSRCGAPAGAEDTFCARCGARLPSAEQPAAAARRTIWRPLLWILVPLVVAVAALMLTNPSRQAYARWLTSQSARSVAGPAARLAPALLAAAAARGTLAQNDVIFTIFDTRLRGVRIDVLGIFDQFVPLGGSPSG